MNDILTEKFEDCVHLTMKSNSERNVILEEVMITSCSNTDQWHRKHISFILWRTINMKETVSRRFSRSLSASFCKFSKFTYMETLPSFRSSCLTFSESFPALLHWFWYRSRTVHSYWDKSLMYSLVLYSLFCSLLLS